MLNKRELLLTLGAIAVAGQARAQTPAQTAARVGRPPLAERRFTSPAIEQVITQTKKKLKDKSLADLFENCFPNTLDTTVTTSVVNGKPDTFIITGDIDAMWLRDSSAQVWPYLPYAAKDKALTTLFRGLIWRQARCILLDPYANAFMRDPTAMTNLEWSASDDTEMKPGVAERKWELDGLCYPVRLAHGYWKATGDTVPFDDEWRHAMRTVVHTFRVQQRKTDPGPYRFLRNATASTEMMPLNGYGAPTKKVGLIHSGFRPSDDACVLPFLIPSNLFAAVSLRHLAEMAGPLGFDSGFRAECTGLAEEIGTALAQYGRHRLPDGTIVWAYEADGFGNTLFMDDANTPGLLGLPYLGACETEDTLYQATRAAVWSDANPYFFVGAAGEGIGGPHIGMNMIWPMSIIMRALTSDDEVEIAQSLKTLQTTTAGTGFIHESFDKDDPAKFTRPWFAWANTLFGELVLDIVRRKPKLVV
ncbi:hypothetical protein AEAC466_18760 [Asticcacaulis sp. AC466]|uniref:glycoside hydrolase family 125 protein n=1 Tax=Asticcacaulis sp. AC466 TaxID=1282362 RepID=UPI0003C3D7E7|nr:glycoside hydrolase family 125 protein [Asticcacaulis sp. AC466]ESQ82179.1 hypothetical protein AEAC466_18760 [Asticcacaulis sp. AC466]